MPEATHPAPILRFGVFELDLRAGELRKQGLKVRLQERPLQILALLLDHPGEVVTREELRQQLWSADTFVDFDHSVNTGINKLREALGDSAESPRFVETLPRHGYRFICHVEPVKAVRAPPTTESHPATTQPGTSSAKDQPAGDSVPAVGAHTTWPIRQRRKRVRIAALVAGGVVAILTVLIAFNVARLRDRLLPSGGANRGMPFPKIESIAVLPFDNLSGDPGQEYFTDGMTEELITDLGKISALRVISRTSVMRYKNTHKPLPEIARELHVDAVVEGTVLRLGDRVRITANLLYARNDRHLWAQAYERNLTDVLSLQDQVARTIASQIRIKLTPDERARLAASRPVKPEAHRLYLLGRFYWNKRTEESSEKAIGFFERAIEIDSFYAPAYAGLADSYILLGDWGYLRPREAYPKAKAAARKALQINEASAEAHTSLAYIYFEYDWDWASSEREFKRAIELNPNYATAHQWHSEYLSAMRRHAEAIAEAQRGAESDPLSPIVSAEVPYRYFFARQYQEAIRRFQDTVSMFPDFAIAYDGLAVAYLAKGMYPEAISAFQKEGSLLGAKPMEVAALGQAYGKGGIRGYYLWELRKLREISKHRYVRAAAFAGLFTCLGEKEKALSYLERGYEDRDWWLALLQIDPSWDPLRSDPRFQTLLRRMNFPQ